MAFGVGDVISIPYFPHKEDKKNGEPRWAIIIEDLQNEFLLLGLTTQLHQLDHYPDGFIIQKDSIDGLEMGLIDDSIVCCGTIQYRKEFTMKKTFFRIPPMKKRGECSEEMLDRIINLCP